MNALADKVHKQECHAHSDMHPITRPYYSTLESGLGRCAFDAHRVNPPQEVDWNRIATEFIVYSSNNDKITHGYAPMNSNIVEAFASRPPYALYSPSKIRTMMAYHGLSCWDTTD